MSTWTSIAGNLKRGAKGSGRGSKKSRKFDRDKRDRALQKYSRKRMSELDRLA